MRMVFGGTKKLLGELSSAHHVFAELRRLQKKGSPLKKGLFSTCFGGPLAVENWSLAPESKDTSNAIVK